jgi:DNA-directed RNA polymerase specialized sigma24 family protein
MGNDDPVTLWIDQLRDEDEDAARNLWNHFVSRLYDSARKKLRPETRRVYDEEDAAQSAFHSVCVGISQGRFPDLHDRESLWRLLLVVTSRKVSHRHRFDQQQRRDVRRISADSVFIQSQGDSTFGNVGAVSSREPTPEFVAEFIETCDTLFTSLEDESLQDVATLRMEGYQDSEIAQRLGCSRRTVQRRLEVIRRHWEASAG